MQVVELIFSNMGCDDFESSIRIAMSLYNIIDGSCSIFPAAVEMSDLTPSVSSTTVNFTPTPRNHAAQVTSTTNRIEWHGHPPQTEGHESPPQMEGHESPPQSEGQDVGETSAPVKGHATESPAVPEQRRSALKDIHSLSSLRRQPTKNSRVSFGRFVTVAEYSPDKSRSFTDEGVTEEHDAPPPGISTAISSPDKSEDEDFYSLGDGGAGSVGEGREASLPLVLEPLNDEEKEAGEENEDELDEEPQEEVEERR